MNASKKKYLEFSKYIDWDHPIVMEKAKALAEGLSNDEEVAKSCFEFVRDQIKHSGDYQLNPITCKASDVLASGTGYCYAKSHLLCALLRANGIPSGLCYQRLTITDQPPFSLHGLNAIYLEQYGWYRVDARGNKKSVNAQFCPPVEQLAFPIRLDEEGDFPEIYSEPLPEVIHVLETYNTFDAVMENLPDKAIGRVKLRSTKLEDLEWLSPFYESIMKPYYRELNLKWDTEKFIENFDVDVSSIILLDDDEIGYLKVENRGDYLYLGDIQLKPSFQNKGIGTRLIKDVQAQALSVRLPLRLRVLKTNPVINLYKKLGFQLLEENEISHIMEYNHENH